LELSSGDNVWRACLKPIEDRREIARTRAKEFVLIGKGSSGINFPPQSGYVTFEWYAIEYYSPEATMSAITATEARKRLFGLIQQVNDDHTVVEVVSRHGNAVILSKEDYDAMTETAYLLRNPANAERLLAAIDRARRGEFEQHDLLDA